MLSSAGSATWARCLALTRLGVLMCKMGVTAVFSLRGLAGMMYGKHFRNCRARSKCYSRLPRGRQRGVVAECECRIYLNW